MGLGIVKALSIALNGNVTVKSTENVGSVFTFTICATEREESMRRLLRINNSTSITSPYSFKRELVTKRQIFPDQLNVEPMALPPDERGANTFRVMPRFQVKGIPKGFGKKVPSLHVLPSASTYLEEVPIYIYIKYIYIYIFG